MSTEPDSPEVEVARLSVPPPASTLRRRGVGMKEALGWVALTYAISLLGQLAVNSAAAHLIGIGGYASFATITTITVLVSQFAVFGIQTAGLRDATSMRDGATDAVLREHLARIRTVLRLFLPFAGVAAGGLCALLTWNLLDERDVALVAIAVGVTTYTTGQQRLFANYMRGFGDVRMSSWIEGRSGGAMFLGLQAIALALLVAYRGHAGLTAILILTLAASIPGSLIGRRRALGPIRRARARWQPLADARATIRTGVHFSVLQTSVYLDTAIDLLVAYALLPATLASLQAAGQRLGALIIVPSTLITLVMSPTIVRLTARPRELGRFLSSATAVALFAGALITAPFVIAPGPLFSLAFGNGFGNHTTALRIIAIGYLMRTLSSFAVTTLSMTGRERIAARVLTATVTFRILAEIGAALTGSLFIFVGVSLIVTLTSQTYLMWLTRRATGVSVWPTSRPDLGVVLRAMG